MTAKNCVKFIDFEMNLFWAGSVYNQSNAFSNISATVMNMEIRNLKVFNLFLLNKIL